MKEHIIILIFIIISSNIIYFIYLNKTISEEYKEYSRITIDSISNRSSLNEFTI